MGGNARSTLRAREATALYVECRGVAMGTSTVRLRWQLRRLPQFSADERTKVRRQAILAELTDRGVA